MTTIDDLNEYCLIEIFSYLDIRQRQRLESVCKRWRDIIPIMWLPMRKFEFVLSGPNTPSHLITIRNGLKVKSKNLSHLGVILEKFHGDLEKLAIRAEFMLDQPLDNVPNCIPKLIIENENLTSLEIHLNHPIYKECLQFLKTDNLQHLKLSLHIRYKSSTSLLDVIKKFVLSAPRLETLHLTNVKISIEEINKITTLKSLYLNNLDKSPTLSVEKFNFINLESIHLLQCPNVNDDFIKQLVEDCKKLCNVELYNCDRITARGLIPITTLPKLRHFGISKLDNEVFDRLSNVESIVCSFLTLNEETKVFSIESFLCRSPNLKKCNVCVNGNDDYFDDYARNLGIVLDNYHHNSCFCLIEWKKQKSTKDTKPVTYSRRNDPLSWLISPSPPESRSSWIYAENRPLITFTSSVNMIPIFSFRRLKNELKNPTPEREFYQQGTDKWYKGYPISCFYQATCSPPNITGTTICHCCTRPLH
ncbi:hypothetical protein PV326_007844 [Microctonus aethiopoides]|nr:hypothetical protein PV326_007844 [Microctonus aethiopoides]